MGPHRADVVVADGTVVELQHSPISPAEIRAREEFYGQSMLWIFDAVQPARSGRLDLRARHSRGGGRYTSFRWRHPRKSVATCTAQVLLDLGDDRLLDVKKLHPDAPCGGWGYLVSASDVRAWLRDDGSQAGAA
jgi:competence protein CoiA